MSPLARLVLIEWVDSRQPTASWQRVSDLGYLSECKCNSIGFLIRDDANAKVLAASIADDGEETQATGVFVIPTVAVLSLQLLTASSLTEPASKQKRQRTSRGR